MLDSPGAGRGVFASESFVKGQWLETAPVLVIPAAQLASLRETGLRYYVWNWGSSVAVGLGIISLVNHGVPANAKWSADYLAGELSLIAVDDIEIGEEVLVDYSRGGTRPLPFDPRPADE